MALSTAVAVGCKGPGDDIVQVPAPRPVTFQGKVDPKFTGDWKSAVGGSSLHLATDGSMKAKSEMQTMKGKSVTDVSGKWLVDGDSLVLQYAMASRQVSVKYSAALSGSTLTLTQGRLKTVYKRK